MVFLCVPTLYAQTGRTMDSLNKRLEQNTNWSPRLELSASQQQELKQLEHKFFQKLSIARGANKPVKEKSEEIKEIYQWRDKEIARILSAEQLILHNEQQKKLKEKVNGNIERARKQKPKKQ